MAAEIQYRHSATGSTMRATVRKEQTVGGKAQYWNGSAWEDLTVANWANYLVTLTETPASSYEYIGTMPAVAAGWYYVDIYSGTAISSTLEATLFGYWNGTNIFLGGADTRELAGTTQTARDIGASVLLSSGTGTGQISLSSGEVTPTAASKTGYSLTNLTVTAGTTLGAGTHTAQTGDSYALANGTSGFVALKGDTAAILLDTGTDGVLLANGAITNASLAGNMEIVFETDFATNYNTTRDAWVTNVQDFVGTTGSDPFSAKVVAASVAGEINTTAGTIKTLDALDTAQDAQHLVTQTAVGNIAVTGSPSYKESASFTVTGGTITETNDYTFTTTTNASYHSLTPATTSIDGYYSFQLEADEIAVSVAFKGRLYSSPTAGRSAVIQVWDWTLGSPDWVTLETINAVNTDAAASDVTRAPILVTKYTGTGANLGQVRIRIYGTGLTTSTPFRVDQLVVGRTVRTGGITNGSTVTLAGSNTNKSYEGYNWILALGGQDISGSYFRGSRQVTGTSSGTTPVTFEDCTIGSGSAGATLPPGTYIRCVFNTPTGQPFTAASSGQYVFIDCVSGVAGSGTPYFDFSPVTTTTGINFRRWSGGSHITTDSNCTGTMEVVTGGGQTLVTGGASWELRGICRAVTITLTGGETVRVDAVTGPVAIDGVGTGSTVRVYGVSSTVTSTASGSPTVEDASVSQATVNAQVDTALETESTARGEWFVSKTGSDSNNGRSWATAKLTLGAAKTAASAPATIYVGSGSYNERDLAKNGINWYFLPGASVDYTGTSGAIFDDAGSTVSYSVFGNGSFAHSGASGNQHVIRQAGASSIVSFDAHTVTSSSVTTYVAGKLILHASAVSGTDNILDVAGGSLVIDAGFGSGGSHSDGGIVNYRVAIATNAASVIGLSSGSGAWLISDSILWTTGAGEATVATEGADPTMAIVGSSIKSTTYDLTGAGSSANVGVYGTYLKSAKLYQATGLLTSLSTVSSDLAAINAECDTALSDIDLDHWTKNGTAVPAFTAGTYLDQMLDDGTEAYDRTSDSLQAARDHATTIKTDTGNIASRITANLFSGITYLKNWLGALAGKTADAATRAEINATTAGAGYNETTDSLEANRDNIGTAGAGLTSVSGLTAGQAASLAAIEADTNELQTDWTNGGRLDLILDKMAPRLIGTLSGAGTGTEICIYSGVTATYTVDASGNITNVTFS